MVNHRSANHKSTPPGNTPHIRHLTKSCLWLFVSLLFLTGCTTSPEPPLRLGSGIWPGYEPLFLARDLGFYDDTQIKLVEFTSASEVIRSLRNHTIDAAALTMDETLTLIDNNIDLRIILVMDFSNGGDVLLAKPEIKELKDITGKKIAIEYTATGAILLDGALTAAELTPADVELVFCPVDQHENCYLSADAVVTYEPTRTRLLNQGAHQLFDSSLIPGRIVDVLVALQDSIEKQPQSIHLLLAGYFKSLHHLKNNPQDATQRMSARLQLSPAEVLASYDGLSLPGLDLNKTLFQGKPSPIQITTSNLISFMVKQQLLTKPLIVDHLFDAQFILGDNE
ncbi:Hydroxymethylpyrimidine ABC transporter, substrate-binding component [hydrothermal vent metagenome]|uniref:Hydroxymethylpyrimidine ABC transporter, substrate-binding component n=1 Tax=hydrothermal vent metagenome TaxID=652676 RepID=A0A3B0ZWM2_9ZZZZ